MSNIKYVAISDMHLGAENSLLTNLISDSYETDPSLPSPVLVDLVNCLRSIISENDNREKPKLILNGDFAELSLTTRNRAFMAVQRFFQLIMPAGEDRLFDDEIVFLAGNHDHHLWEDARSDLYLQQIRNTSPGDYIDHAVHTTKIFGDTKVSSQYLTCLIQSYPHLKNVTVSASYPAYGAKSNDAKKCVIFSHGHYVESMYSLMTTLRNKIFPDRELPQTFHELEIENYAWVDFFWSTLGRSGSVGKDIELIYDKLQDPKHVNALISNIAKSEVGKKNNTAVDWLEEKSIALFLSMTVGKLASSERNEPAIELTPDAEKGLRYLIEKILTQELQFELNHMPEDVTFIFGHTHKPFQKTYDYEGYKNKVKVYNSGGWVVDTMHQQPLHGGSIVLVDEHLNTCSLQMYKEGKYFVTVESTDGERNPLADHVNSVMSRNAAPWSEFEKNVETHVKIRHKNLQALVEANSL